MAIASFVPAARTQERAAPTISRITVRSTDIFDFETKPYLRRFPYGWINALHIKTKEHVIRQELLFSVGEPLDEFVIQETERNLRNLSFIRAARITQFPQRDGTVVLVVYANDSWTTEPQLNVEGINSFDEVEFAFKEKNLFGLGKSLEFGYTTDSDSDFEEKKYRFTDPRVFNSRWRFQTELISHTEGGEQNFLIERPYFSAGTRWAARGFYGHEEQTIEEFQGSSVKTSEFELDKEVSEAAISRKIGDGRIIVHRVGPRYRRELQRYRRTAATEAGTDVPENDTFQTVFVDYQFVKNDFITTNRVEKITRIEDINLGPTLLVSPGFSPKFLTGDPNASGMQITASKGFLFDNADLLVLDATHESRATFENRSNERYTAETTYFHRRSPLQTWVLHSRLDWGHRLDADNRVTLGGDNGLRSFEPDSLVGERSLLLNIEDRLYITDEIFNLFALGAVVFFDAGYVWESGATPRLSDMRTDTGVGLRIALTRSSDEVVLRLDFGYRLHRVDSDDAKFVVSFGSGQAF